MIVNKLLNYNSSKYSLDEKEDIRAIDKDLITIFNCLQGRVRFGAGTSGNSGENIEGMWYTLADTGTANAEFTIPHTLGVVPIGWLTVSISNAGVIYKGSTAWTTTNLYLKCSTANASIKIFILR